MECCSVFEGGQSWEGRRYKVFRFQVLGMTKFQLEIAEKIIHALYSLTPPPTPTAQSVRQQKANKVLQDVIRTMFASSFVNELFRPQEMYTSSSTRQIFNKLAHSSIMRINETSMDKLYDLMTMGVKHQWVCCNVPQQMIQNTFNHLTAMGVIAEGSEVMELVEVRGRGRTRSEATNIGGASKAKERSV